jgi:hypothetical protein
MVLVCLTACSSRREPREFDGAFDSHQPQWTSAALQSLGIEYADHVSAGAPKSTMAVDYGRLDSSSDLQDVLVPQKDVVYIPLMKSGHVLAYYAVVWNSGWEYGGVAVPPAKVTRAARVLGTDGLESANLLVAGPYGSWAIASDVSGATQAALLRGPSGTEDMGARPLSAAELLDWLQRRDAELRD